MTVNLTTVNTTLLEGQTMNQQNNNLTGLNKHARQSESFQKKTPDQDSNPTPHKNTQAGRMTEQWE